MTNLSIIKRAKEWIIKEEGFREKPYLCTNGVLTFGHGLTWITKEESLALVDNRVNSCIKEMDKILKDNSISLDEFRKTILVDMLYQMGYNRVCTFKKMIKALAEMDYEVAADEMLDSKWHIDTPVRCKELSERMRKGF